MRMNHCAAQMVSTHSADEGCATPGDDECPGTAVSKAVFRSDYIVWSWMVKSWLVAVRQKCQVRLDPSVTDTNQREDVINTLLLRFRTLGGCFPFENMAL